jgi:uncharacterized protein
VKIEFDPLKSERNNILRGLAFDCAHDFDWDSALIVEDMRRQYPERRFVAAGLIDDRLHMLCFTPVVGGIRVISLRKANEREGKRYAKEITD